MKSLSTILLVFVIGTSLIAQNATITEESMTMTTYPFSEPDPVPKLGNIYPYFRFDGYSDQGVDKEWKMVVLENEYIKVLVAPEIGGKVWGAIEKSTGKEFLYYNKVVKFRDIAMRGPWTSGGLEYNFGDIGHIPTGATPVDYVIKTNDDGSVSCIVGALDLPSRTKWNVEIRLPADKAFLETKVTWENTSDLPVTYYHWMNAAAKARGNLQFLYPGSARIGHGGEVGNFPIDNDRDISFYENNDFGPYKSYHVLNAYSNFFGGYWHDDDFGFGHMTDYDEKPGKKIWIWGLSEQGMIWEDLLTDNDGQYVEYQSGKLFNQAAQGSAQTPFKHREFMPHDSDHMVDKWFPVLNTGGMVAASEYAVLNTEWKNDVLSIKLSALQNINEELVVRSGQKELMKMTVSLAPLELMSSQLKISKDTEYTIELGDHLLFYSSNPKDRLVDRPLAPNKDFDWDSANGLYVKGLELEKQRNYVDAQKAYIQSLEKEPGFSLALNRLALSQYRKMEYHKAVQTISRSLAIDTYDPEANYIFGLANEKLGSKANAKSGYSIATQHPGFRVAGYTALAKMHLVENDLRTARSYAKKALQFNQKNTSALEMLTVINRKEDNKEEQKNSLSKLQSIDPTNALAANELQKIKKGDFLNQLVTNELPHESYLELALAYVNYGDSVEAVQVLNASPANAITKVWTAYLEKNQADLEAALDISPELVLPHRVETLMMMESLMENNDHWKLKYYTGLIYWYKGRSDKAKALFLACEDIPDFAPFYLAKIALFQETGEHKKKSLNSALKLAPENWRVNFSLAQYHYENQNYEASKRLTSKFLNRPTGVGMLHAKVLLKLEQYQEAVKFLEGFNVLPFEGANESRNLYHQANVMAALDAYSAKKYKRALTFAKKAHLWPRNLGAGRPYDVDERLDNFLLAKIHEKLGNASEAQNFKQKVTEHQPNQFIPESANLIFQALALRDSNENSSATDLLKKRIAESPNSADLQWVMQAFEGRDDIVESNKNGRDLRLTKAVLAMLGR